MSFIGDASAAAAAASLWELFNRSNAHTTETANVSAVLCIQPNISHTSCLGLYALTRLNMFARSYATWRRSVCLRRTLFRCVPTGDRRRRDAEVWNSFVSRSKSHKCLSFMHTHCSRFAFANVRMRAYLSMQHIYGHRLKSNNAISTYTMERAAKRIVKITRNLYSFCLSLKFYSFRHLHVLGPRERSIVMYFYDACVLMMNTTHIVFCDKAIPES